MPQWATSALQGVSLQAVEGLGNGASRAAQSFKARKLGCPRRDNDAGAARGQESGEQREVEATSARKEESV